MIARIKIPRFSWRDLAITVGPFVVLLVVAFWIAAHFVRPAPPDTIVIASGPESSSFTRFAERYAKILAREGVTLKVVPSQGALDNLKRLTDRKSGVDIGFVQGGLAGLADTGNLVSLGSIFYEPVFLFYRSPKPITLLSELAGKRIAVGREGSGTRVLAETLLKANGIEPKGGTTFLDLVGKPAKDALLAKQADAALGQLSMFTTASPIGTTVTLRPTARGFGGFPIAIFVRGVCRL